MMNAERPLRKAAAGAVRAKSTHTVLLAWVALAFLMPGAGKVAAQDRFTPYDNLPGVVRNCKPAYEASMPVWAQMLYRYPANLSEIDRAFASWKKENRGKKSAAERYYLNWRRAVGMYATEEGEIVLPDTKRIAEDLLSTQRRAGARPAASHPASTGWTFTGPKETFWLNETGNPSPPPSCPWQVNVYSMQVAPTDPDIIYCGTETGFVNKTTDKGLHWQPIGLNYPFGGAVTAVAVHPADAATVYVSAGSQVHRSTDGGATWTPLLSTGNRFAADRLRIDPVNPQRLFAAAPEGVFASTDGGNTWVKRWNAQAWDVEIRPGDNMQVFALTEAAGKFSVIQSTDGGVTFQAQASFPATIPESSGGLLATTPANPGLMMAILLSANDTPYLLKGTASGTTWSWSLQATGGTSSFPMDNGQGYFDLVLEVSPLNPDLVLTGTTTLFKSVNGGTSFTAVGGYYGAFDIHPDIQDMQMLPNGETWVATDGGMNLSTDNFTQAANYFVRVNGLLGSDFWGFDQGWNEDICVGGRYHNGNTAIAEFYQPKALRMGGAESPTGWMVQGRSRHAAFNDLGNGWILPATATGVPEGRFLFTKYPNMDEYGGRRGNLVHHPAYSGTLYLGEGTGFWRSEDAGVTWDLLYNFPSRVRYFQVSYSDPEIIYADIAGGGLVRSADGGMTWELKPSLTSPPNGNSGWKGKLFIAVSPHDGNVVYACLQNGTWSADIGKIFRSADGGDTWTDLTGGLSEYMKCIVVQPATGGGDLVYLFTNATGGKSAQVYYRHDTASAWTPYHDNYPAGTTVNLALPFFRDSKLRVAGNAGVWEAPLADTTYTPLLRPWVEKALYNCLLDTVQLDDHSMIDHTGASWQWTITPVPAWIDNPSARNPRLVPGAAGTYDVTMTITKNGQTYSKAVPGMFSATSCPSIYDCSNPGTLPKEEWDLVYVDSEEVNDPGLAVMCFDGNPSTIWHTRWSTGSDPYPHEIRLDLGRRYKVSRFTLLNRQDGENGRIRSYEVFISNDTLQWGVPAAAGLFENTSAPQEVVFDTVASGRYFRLLALSEVNGNPWASVAELSLTGCVDWPAGDSPSLPVLRMPAFPVPTAGIVRVPLPGDEPFGYRVVSVTGGIRLRGSVTPAAGMAEVDLSALPAGTYLLLFRKAGSQEYRVRVVRE